MPEPTYPPITDAQNEAHFLRLLAAQRRLYSDVSGNHNRRLLIVIALALLTLAVGSIFPKSRSAIGGIAALLLGVTVLVAELRENSKNSLAASIQEEFDTGLYRLSWHTFLVERPNDWDIAKAADRASSEGLRDWYQPESIGRLARPLDVLVCQRANLDYGVSLHRAYATTLGAALALSLTVVIATAASLGLTGWALTFGLIAPLTPSAASVVREILAHLESARKKAAAQRKVAGLWRKGLEDPAAITDADCRAAQDCILAIRQSNARVPDRFYWRVRDRNEALMLATCTDLVEQARKLGHLHPEP